ncbi:MAG: hypothetical protein HKM93_16000 [Desulfobacteraceae bacterium]|nr:hypothetical protein [Desulfobacteraceae bacterium]
MRIPHKLLKSLSDATGFSVTYLSDIAATRKRPGRTRAMTLEKAAKKINADVPAILWLYGSSTEIKTALSRPA